MVYESWTSVESSRVLLQDGRLLVRLHIYSSFQISKLISIEHLAHGAQTLLVTSPKLPSLPTLDIETSLGKRTAQLDLRNESDRATLLELAEIADVFLQAYRPGSLNDKGFGSSDILRLKSSGRGKNSVVYAQLSAWGWSGPWKDKRGVSHGANGFIGLPINQSDILQFDSLVQTATGFNLDEGLYYDQSQGTKAEGTLPNPRPFPMQALDHAAGYFLSFGVCAALCRQITVSVTYEESLVYIYAM